MSAIKTKLGDHWAIIGATGTGKTQFILKLINDIARATGGFLPIYIIDSKCPIPTPQKSDFRHLFLPKEGVGRRFTGDEIPPIIRPKGKNFVVVWSPETENKEMYEEFFRRIYKEARPCLVIIDELSSITTESGRAGRYYNILLKQGRGLEISMVSATQSSSYVPQSLIRQAMHLIVFRQNYESDNKKLYPAMGRVLDEPIADEFGFRYRPVQVPIHKAPTQYYKENKEFFGY